MPARKVTVRAGEPQEVAFRTMAAWAHAQNGQHLPGVATNSIVDGLEGLVFGRRLHRAAQRVALSRNAPKADNSEHATARASPTHAKTARRQGKTTQVHAEVPTRTGQRPSSPLTRSICSRKSRRRRPLAPGAKAPIATARNEACATARAVSPASPSSSGLTCDARAVTRTGKAPPGRAGAAPRARRLR